MKCREALKHLYDFLDQQLDSDTIDQVKKHLNECKHCFDTYKFEKDLNTLIKTKSNGNYSTAVETLKSTVMSHIAQIDAESRSSASEEEGSSTGFFLFRRPVLGVTFLAVIAVVSLYFFVTTSNPVSYAEFIPFIENHKQVLKGDIPMDISSDNIFSIDSCLSISMSLPKHIFIKDEECIPKMARINNVLNTPCAQIVYAVHGSEVSIFVIAKEDYDFPEKELTKIEDMPNAYTYQYNSQNLMLWQCPKYWYVAVSILDQESIKHLVLHMN